MRFARTLLLTLLAISACTSVERRESPEIAAAISAARAGRSAESRSLFQKACDEGFPAACLRLQKPIDLSALPHVPILQGVTDSDTTQIAILTTAGEDLDASLWVWDGSVPIDPSERKYQVFSGSDFRILKLKFRGLERGKEYQLQIVRPSGELIDVRRLRTLDSAKSRVRFAVASCMDDAYREEQKGMWEGLLSQNPEMIFLIGDVVYADKPLGSSVNPNRLWTRHAETRSLLQLFRADPLVPILATWDDHDYGANDGDMTFPYRKESTEIFSAFFAQDPVPGLWERGPGVSGVLTAFGQRFFLMDDRSFRSAPQISEGQTHWGKEQEDWLFLGLASGSSPTWLMNGDQFFGGYHRFESYEGNHPVSFRAFLQRLRIVPNPLVFVSGDRHLAEIMEIPPSEIGYRTYELTTSAIHAKTFADAWKDTPNPKQIAGASGALNYLVVDSEARPDGLAIDATVYGEEGRTLFSRRLRVDTKARRGEGKPK